MSFTALSDRVLIERDEVVSVSAGGVILAEVTRKLPTIGTVISAGPGARALDGSLMENAVRAGDRVYFSEYAGQDIEVDGAEYILLREGDVLGVVQ